MNLSYEDRIRSFRTEDFLSMANFYERDECEGVLALVKILSRDVREFGWSTW